MLPVNEFTTSVQRNDVCVPDAASAYSRTLHPCCIRRCSSHQPKSAHPEGNALCNGPHTHPRMAHAPWNCPPHTLEWSSHSGMVQRRHADSTPTGLGPRARDNANLAMEGVGWQHTSYIISGANICRPWPRVYINNYISTNNYSCDRIQ